MAKKKSTSTKTKKAQKSKLSRSPKSSKKPIGRKPSAAKKTAARVSSSTKAAKKKRTKELTPRERKLQDIKKNLLKQKESLLLEAEQALNALPGQTVFPDMGDQATAEIDRNFMLRLRSREQKLLKKIEGAIERIDNGTFGICDNCGEEIDIRRLEARPVTTMCIECKIQQEEEEKLRET